MYAIRVMPIARGVFKDNLTFFSREEVKEGSVVSVTIRNRRVPALVMDVSDVREEKMDIRSADFSLKKIESANGKRLFSRAFMEAVKETARWHAASESVVTAALTSNVILTSLGKAEEAPQSAERTSPDVRAEVLLLQSERSERLGTYRNLAREAFARNASLVILAPTVREAELLSLELSRGIEDRVVLLSGDLSKKKLIEAWNSAVGSVHPIVIVGTTFVLSVPRADVDTFVVERESARAYRGIQRPYVDIRRAAELVAKKSGARIILADFPVRTETRYRKDAHDAEEFARFQTRPMGNVSVSIVDVRKKDNHKGEKRVFTTLSPDTKEKLREEIKSGGRAAIFAARRGLSPLTVCNDCGTPIADPDTDTPMTLHKTARGNVFISHRTGAEIPAEIACRTCGGWNLVTLGIGVDRVYEELSKEFPETEIILFTKDTAPTHKQAVKLAQRFYAATGALIVGTERMLPYLAEAIETVAVASIDSMLSLPAWRAHEQALSILFYLNERADRRLIIETRQPESEVMKTLASGNPADFYRMEIEEREKYGYPPFSVFVGLTMRGPRQLVEKQRLDIKEMFSGYDLVGPLPPEQYGKTEWFSRAVIRIPKGSWPDDMLSIKLLELPPNIGVAIDPDEIV